MNQKFQNDRKVSIIILNWNGWKDTIECLESLYQINYLNYEVIIVDNNSENDSIKKIRQYCSGKLKPESKFFKYNPNNKPIKIIECTEEKAESKNLKQDTNIPSNKKLTLIKNNQNYGFAEGNNIGIRYALKNQNPDHILLLNNDTVVEKNFLTEMTNFCENNDSVGVLGAINYYYDQPEEVWFIGGVVNFWKGRLYPAKIKGNKAKEVEEVDYVAGSCLLITKETINMIGFLNQKYFIYHEDVEFCIRVKEAGFKVFCLLTAQIWHKTGSSNFSPKLYYETRNWFCFMKNHASAFQKISFMLYFSLFTFFRTTIGYSLSKRFKELNFFFKGINDGFKCFIN